MGDWNSALVFALAVLSFVLGLSSIIMGLLPSPANAVKENIMKEKVEYGFFGVSALVLCSLFVYALS